MIRKVDYTMHSACLAAVVTIGDAIIYLPSEYRGEAMLPGFLIASAAAVLIFLASHFLCVYSSGGACAYHFRLRSTQRCALPACVCGFCR